MTSRFAIVGMLLLVFAATPAFACKVCDGCECGMMGCGPCDATCFEPPLGSERWELASVQIIPAARDASAPDWILVDIRTIPAAVR